MEEKSIADWETEKKRASSKLTDKDQMPTGEQNGQDGFRQGPCLPLLLVPSGWMSSSLPGQKARRNPILSFAKSPSPQGFVSWWISAISQLFFVHPLVLERQDDFLVW